jgi:hypothetical protein
LKQLPDFIIESIDAYIGCVAGSILKDDYIKAMENAGFTTIEVLNETRFPIDVLTINPKVMEIVKEMNIEPKMLKDIANSVVSIKVKAYKE